MSSSRLTPLWHHSQWIMDIITHILHRILWIFLSWTNNPQHIQQRRVPTSDTPSLVHPFASSENIYQESKILEHNVCHRMREAIKQDKSCSCPRLTSLVDQPQFHLKNPISKQSLLCLTKSWLIILIFVDRKKWHANVENREIIQRVKKYTNAERKIDNTILSVEASNSVTKFSLAS